MSRKLLLADDSVTVQRVLQLTLAGEGLDIATVGDGQRAIEEIEREPPDLVLADLSMPLRDGYAVAEHVKHSPELVGLTRVVLLTGAFEPVDEVRAKRLGVDGVLAKPFEPRVAIELVRRLMAAAPLLPEPTVSALAMAAGNGRGQKNTGGVAEGYPFEPGTKTGKSSASDLDDYFRRLDEALASAGMTASPAVKHMLAESRPAAGAAAAPVVREVSSGEAASAEKAPRDESASTRPAAVEGPKTTAAAPGAAASAGGMASAGPPGTVKEDSAMELAPPPGGPTTVTLVDAFSALLAAEQGEPAEKPESADQDQAYYAGTPIDTGKEAEPGEPVEASDSGELEFSAPSPITAADAEPVSMIDAPPAWAAPPPPADEPQPAPSGWAPAAQDPMLSAPPAWAPPAPAESTSMESASLESASLASASTAVDIFRVESSGPADVEPAPVAPAQADMRADFVPPPIPALPAVPAPPPAASFDAPKETPQISEELIEAVVRRVLAQMTDGVVREIVTARVLDVAERLVREEIDRIKLAADELD